MICPEYPTLLFAPEIYRHIISSLSMRADGEILFQRPRRFLVSYFLDSQCVQQSPTLFAGFSIERPLADFEIRTSPARCHLQYYWANTWLAWANYFAKNVMGKVRAWIGTSLILLLGRRAKFNSQRESRYFEYEFCKPEKHKLSTTGKQTLYETAWDADRRRIATCPSQASCRLHNNTITGWHLGILLREKKWSPAP